MHVVIYKIFIILEAFCTYVCFCLMCFVSIASRPTQKLCILCRWHIETTKLHITCIKDIVSYLRWSSGCNRIYNVLLDFICHQLMLCFFFVYCFFFSQFCHSLPFTRECGVEHTIICAVLLLLFTILLLPIFHCAVFVLFLFLWK